MCEDSRKKSESTSSGFVKLQKSLEPKLDIVLYFAIACNAQVHNILSFVC
jgi:hypothetical protein